MNPDAERSHDDESNSVNTQPTPAFGSMKTTRQLKEDHGQILRALDVLEEMAARVRRKQPLEPEDTLELVAFLPGYADRHHQGTEEGVFELVETALSPEEDARVALEMENFDRVWRKHALPDLLRRLDKMQSEYIGGVRARPATGN